MRFRTIGTLIFATSVGIFGSTALAQRPAQNPPGPPPSAQSGPEQQSGSSAAPDQNPFGLGLFGPGGRTHVVGRAPRFGGPPIAIGRDQNAGGPLQRVSRLLAALDDPRVRTMLGLTDQQADSLRKIIVGTETFTITTGAMIAVDSIDVRELLRADKPDRAAVMAKGDEISKSTSALINHYLDAILAAKAVLTPEQQKMIRAYMERENRAVSAPALPAPPGR